MSAAHWHLVLNHLPLLGILFGALLLAYGLWRDQTEVQQASLGLLAVAGLAYSRSVSRPRAVVLLDSSASMNAATPGAGTDR